MSGEDSKVRVPEEASSSGPSMRRDYDSVDDFEHVGHEGSTTQEQEHRNGEEHHHHPEKAAATATRSEEERGESRPVPATPPPSADFEKCEAMARTADPFLSAAQDRTHPSTAIDPKAVTMAFMETERSYAPIHEPIPSLLDEDLPRPSSPAKPQDNATSSLQETSKPVSEKPLLIMDNEPKTEMLLTNFEQPSEVPQTTHEQIDLLGDEKIVEDTARTSSSETFKDHPSEFLEKIESSVLPVPEKSPSIDFLTGDVGTKESKSDNLMDDDSWNIVDRKQEVKPEEFAAPTKPLPPVPKEIDIESDRSSNLDKYEMSHDFVLGESHAARAVKGGAETGDSEFESEPEPSPAKPPLRAPEKPQEPEPKEKSRFVPPQQPAKHVEDIEIAPKQIFRDMGLDAWFNPDRLNPKVAALIYWRDPKKSGIVFGATLVVLLSLAYFSVISVFAYLSLLLLTGTVVYRAGYKTILQAIRKTSEDHPFKDILDVDLTLPTEKVHEVADVVVAHVSASLGELRRLFLVEDFVDSVKFGVLLWCMTYVGSWFNGMTLIIIGVVALFTLPKVYETNKTQVDQNLALVQGKINELTAKVKAAIPLGKKPEPTKEE